MVCGKAADRVSLFRKLFACLFLEKLFGACMAVSSAKFSYGLSLFWVGVVWWGGGVIELRPCVSFVFTFFARASVTTQCLASWFSCRVNSWILTFLAKILANILAKVRKISQDFSRLWKEIQKNSRSFWQQNQQYPRSCQEKQESLASKKYKIYGYLISNYPWKHKKGLLARVLLSEGPDQKRMKQKNRIILEANMKHIGMKKMVQTSTVKMCKLPPSKCVIFSIFFGYIDESILCRKKILSMLPPLSARNLDPTKTAFSEFFFPKKAIDVSVTSSCVQAFKS